MFVVVLLCYLFSVSSCHGILAKKMASLGIKHVPRAQRRTDAHQKTKQKTSKQTNTMQEQARTERNKKITGPTKQPNNPQANNQQESQTDRQKAK